jgi:hypothetical protein
VDRCELLDGFKFDDYAVLDEKIEAVAAIEFHAFVDDWDWLLAFRGDTAQGEFAS